MLGYDSPERPGGKPDASSSLPSRNRLGGPMRHAPTAPAAFAHAIATALPPIPTFTSTIPPAQPGATPRNKAQQNPRPAQNEPTPHPLPQSPPPPRYIPS